MGNKIKLLWWDETEFWLKALCNHLSLIRTAVLHQLDPYAYYVKIFESLPYCNSVEDYEALLPVSKHHEKLGEKHGAAYANQAMRVL